MLSESFGSRSQKNSDSVPLADSSTINPLTVHVTEKPFTRTLYLPDSTPERVSHHPPAVPRTTDHHGLPRGGGGERHNPD